jgi:hypothetical protein
MVRQDKKNTLDNFYRDYADWNVIEKNKIEKEFIEILKEIMSKNPQENQNASTPGY